MQEKIKEIEGAIPATEKNREVMEMTDHFYASIGGIPGYREKVMELMQEKKVKLPEISTPPLSILTDERLKVGLESLPLLAEIYPIGGLGSRLGLRDSAGKLLPAAALSFAGRSLLEGLFRDLEGREYLYSKLYGKSLLTPVALMVSDEEHNFPAILDLLESCDFFGRGRENIRLFKQPSVPVIDIEGNWVLKGEELLVQPNGHGALWKCALDAGIFSWLQKCGRRFLLIRQINNPIGGMDDLLLRFLGYGVAEEKSFGFVSCERPKGVQEGMLVQIKERGRTYISNIEYTDVEHYEIDTQQFPANTNILFADVERLLPTIHQHPLPGLMVNLKGGKQARLESMMQSISDSIDAQESFVAYAPREKVIASAKKRYEEGGSLQSTPEGAYYVMMRNQHELLKSCGFALPSFPSEDEYLREGPSFIFHYLPALGPNFQIIHQKLRGGVIAKKAKLLIEHPDVWIEGLQLAENLEIYGPCYLKNVHVKSARIEGCFWAEDVAVDGEYCVPDGEMWKLTRSGLQRQLIDWELVYRWAGERVEVALHGSTSRRPS